jgi:hypothetical protein
MEWGRVDIPPISRIEGALSVSWSSMVEMADKADGISRLEGEPSEKESGVALNIAMISGVVLGSRRRGERVGIIGTSVLG